MSSFGGTVKLTGEAEYRKALTQITQNLRETSSALNLVDSQYSRNDKSIDTVTAKNEKLNAILEKQKSAYETLKNSFTNIKAKYDEQINAHNKLQAEYDEEKAKLDKLKSTVGENSSAYEKQKAKVGELASSLSKSQSNIDANEVAMSKLRVQMNNAEATINKTKNEIDGLGKETKETTEEVKKSGDGFTVFKGILANLGTQAINSAINGLKSLGSAFINVGKQAIKSYAEYEQLVGGVETLFKDSAPVVQKYANDAYKTAGLSANEYMETVTSFSASLINSLDGDTQKAAELSNVAITDMSDNANKMGTDISMLQNAYSGFARGNYTMLDNLKLGFAGSKEGMQQLLDKANEYNASIGKNTNYQISSYADIVNAIHDVQTQMDITGTTAKEASTTIQGSVGAMKSAWKNLITGIADDNADFGQLVDNFAKSAITALQNLLPRIKTVVGGIGKLFNNLIEEVLPQILEQVPPLLEGFLPTLLNSLGTLGEAILSAIEQLLPLISQMIPKLVEMLVQLLPQLIDVGIQAILSLIQGITDSLPQLIAMLPDIIMQIVDTLVNNLPLIIDTGIQLTFALIDGIIEALPDLIDKIPEIIDKLVMAITDNLPKIIEAGITLTIKLAEGLIKALPQLISKIPQIIGSLVNGIANYYSKIFQIGGELLNKVKEGISNGISKMADVGKNLVEGLWNGINNAKDWIVNKIKGFKDTVLDAIKGFFGIHSPSTVFRDEVGKNLALGLGEGFTEEMKNVTSDMEGAIPSSFDTQINGSYNGFDNSGNTNTTYGFNSIVEAFKTALSEMKIELDDENMGKFIDRTVARTIYS